MPPGRARAARPDWTVLSPHGHVLLAIARGRPDGRHVRLRDISKAVGLTERSVYGLIADLEHAGILERSRVGRENRYHIHRDQPLRHTLDEHRTVGELLDLLAGPGWDAPEHPR